MSEAPSGSRAPQRYNLSTTYDAPPSYGVFPCPPMSYEYAPPSITGHRPHDMSTMYAPPSMASHRPYDMTTVYPAPSMASHRFYKMSMIFRSFEKPPSIGDRDPRAISTKVVSPFHIDPLVAPSNEELADIMSRSLNEHAYLHVPLEDIKSATNNFADENILGEGGAGKLYKAKLTSSGQVIDIVARRLEGQASEFELWREVSMLSSPQHSNLALVIGYCDENGEKIIIYDHSGVHGCLDKHLSDHATLTWSQRMKICLGVAEALQYIHYDDIHCGISTSTVLIDKDGEAKVFGFGLSTSYPGNWVHRLLLSHYNGTSKEVETADRDLVRLTPKYDVYSFGLLLYEVLCGRKPVSTENGVVKEKLHEMIHTDLTEQMSTQSLISLSTLSRLASNCLNQEPMMRPTMDMIVGELKEILKQPEDSEHSKLVDEATPSKSLTKKNKERLKIPLSDIKKATNDFTNWIGEGSFGRVFKAELEHLDIQSKQDWKNKEQLDRICDTVAIKQIFNKQGEEGFLAELEILASCNHKNVVSLLGYSDEEGEMILVFEFALKGSLDDCLKDKKMCNVTWAQRIQICLDVAHGLNYIHTSLEGGGRVVHRDIKSANILLGENWNAKVADFGLSKLRSADQGSTIRTMRVAGTPCYMDPDFSISDNTYKKESDIYSFGVVLFEMLSGRLAYDQVYTVEDENRGLATVARRRFENGTIKELIDPNMMEEANEHIFTINKEPNQKSLDAFTKIAYQCLEDKKVMRPKMEVIIKELENALDFQGESLALIKFRLSDIMSATENFSTKYYVGAGAYGRMYNAKLSYFDRKELLELERTEGGNKPKTHTNIVALKRIFNRDDRQGKQGMFSEIDLLTSFKHPNIVSLLGISNDNKEMIIIYEDDFKGSLHDYLGHPHRMAYLNWAARIQISLDIARALRYLQTFGIKEKQRIMQFAMNSTNILLDAERKAKIACFWLSNLFSADKEANINNTIAKEVQSDVECIKIEKLKSESAIYSFGVILFEILCGKVQYDKTYYSKKEKGLPVIARQCMDEETFLNVMIDPNLKRETDEKTCVLNEEVDKKSFDAFSQIAYKCCAVREAERPSMDVIIEELEKAKNSQVKHFEHLKNGIVEKVKNLIPSIAYEDISSATKEFSKDNIIGSGGYSKVYKGELAKFDSSVAIKQIHAKKDKEGSNGFLAEIQALSNYKHPNIVSLLGFCLEKDEMILVLEYASKGSLDRILRNSDMIANLTWAERINICLNIASGLSYLHTIIDGKQTIHRDVKSANILLNDKWEAKIADFGLCKLNHAYQQSDNMNANIIAGTDVYLDPEYLKTGRLQVESDIYSLGVVLFEILCGKLAYDESFGEGGLPPVARKCFKDGTLKQMIDQRMSKDDEDNSVLNGRVDQNSVQTFSKIAYKCLAEKQRDRPNIKDVIVELKKAYDSQKYSMDKLRMSLEEVRSMTKNFSDSKCIREGRCWKQYEGEMAQANGYIINVVAKRFDSKYDTQHQYFKRELDILSDSKHKNIVGLIRYCQDMDETIIVYEHASNGTLDVHLKNTSVTWMKRLKISIDIASGLHFLHKHGVVKDFWITHTDIRSSNILINGDWTAKISNLESALYSGEHDQVKHVNDDAHRSLGYMDPKNKQSEHVTHKSDIYSLGVVLLEMLCGRLAWEEGCEDHSLSLGPLAKQHFNEGKLDDLVFKGIKDQINPEALDAFVDIAFKCLEDDVGKRPEARAVEIQLRKALEFQEDHEIWEPKLRQYQDMLLVSEMDKNIRKKDIYNKLYKGVLLKDREVFFILGSNEEKQYIISAKKFSYKHQWALNWHHKSRPKSKTPQAGSQNPQPGPQNPQQGPQPPQPGPEVPTPLEGILQGGSHGPQTSQPGTEAPQPVLEVPKPLAGILQGGSLGPQTPQPGTDVPQPGPEVPKPLTGILQGGSHGPQTPQPGTEIPGPEVPKPLSGILQGGSRNPQARSQTAHAGPQTPQLGPKVPQPGPEIPKPMARIPQAKSQIPKPKSSIPQSRFGFVAEMLTRSNLNIKSKIKTQILSPGIDYGVHLVFRFSGERKLSAKAVYVNLKYKIGSETFHAYFATCKDKEWMTIELCRFLNKADTNFEVLLEGFSSCYCGKGAIYIEGIEFRVIDNRKRGEIKEIKQVPQVLKSNKNEGQAQRLPRVSEKNLERTKDGKANKLLLLTEVDKKKQLMFSAKDILYNSSKKKHFHMKQHFHLKPSKESRFEEVLELQAAQVLRISCKIESQMLSKDTKYSCYLVFKILETCRGLHCPVKVRDAFNRKNKEVINLYLRHPTNPWNLHDFNHIPKQREDGWMEVNVWNFNSTHNLKDDFYRLKLKLISYEGTMSGLTVCGLEFRPT